MSQFLDFIPIALFVIVFFVSDIYMATAALMIGVTVQLVIYWVIKKPIGRELKLTFWVSMLFGGLTLFFATSFLFNGNPPSSTDCCRFH